MPNPGKLLVFEGPDGIGKSTLVNEARNILSSRGITNAVLSFPGKDPGTLGWIVDQIHHNREAFEIRSLTPLSLQALHIAAHLDHIESRILPFLAKGGWFVLDRFWWSTWVYGTVDGVSVDVLNKLVEAEQAAWNNMVPTAAFLIKRTSAFRAEQTEGKFVELVTLYEEIASRAAKHHRVISISNDDLSSSVGTIRTEINQLASL